MPSANISKTSRIITPGKGGVTPGTRVLIAASVAGMVRLVLADGSFADAYAVVGTSEVADIAVQDIDVAGTTATCSVSVLG